MSTASTFEREMLALINQERTSRGLDPLQLETRLNDSSEDHSEWMLNSDTFSHTGSGGSSATQRMQDAGFDLSGSWRTGENIAWQSERGAPGINDDVVQLHQGLMDSPGHRANILNPDFKYIGIGIETGDMQGYDAVMVTQNFANTDGPVMLDNGNAPTAPAPTTPTEEVAEPEEPEVETPETGVTETEEPEPETPATEEPTVETPETDVTETEEPEVETPEVEEPETPDTDVTETEEPETETPETEEPETPGTDVTETEEPGEETPETDVVDAGEPELACFDVQAFLDELTSFIEGLHTQLDEFNWNTTQTAANDAGDTDAFEMVPRSGTNQEEEATANDVDMVTDDTCDFYMFNTFSFDCMMDAA
ncbi:CAP domain-containing protein [uncultured Ruegeria sp.]|uniref:CAP domain-containing protein n=1 Tax=uncultured Ruegeria sp. TaxID=259304 RepID=UPI00260CC31D|nr:CAP domain-containing protein [uncultured Ruegeria sp.]